jgi:hypothetical protein
MELTIAWVLFPLVLLALCVGCGLALERLVAIPLPGALLPATGFAVIVVVAQVPTLWDATAGFTVPIVVALAIAGFALSWGRWRRPEPWAVALVILVFAAYAAPIVLSGQATFAGYIRLDDTATWMALTDRVMEHGRSLAGLDPSTYEATLSFNLGDGYPIGVFLPLGVTRALVGQDVAWLIQPYMAFGGAVLGLALWQLAEPIVRPLPLRAAVSLLAALSALLVGYYLWGAIKEVAAAALLASCAGLAGFAIRQRFVPRSLIPLGIAGAALIGVLSGGGGIWLLAVLLPLAAFAVRELGTRATAPIAAAFAIFVGLLCVPVLASGGFLPPTSASLSSATALGNLLRPLNGLQLFGIWPAGDFRVDPAHLETVYALIAVAAVGALVGLYAGWRARAWSMLVYVGAALVAFGVIALIGSPWIEGKAMAIASPALPFAACAGAAWLWGGAGRRVRVWERVAGAAILAIVGTGVVWSGALAYRDVNLAPRDQLAELETIGHRIAGQGPTLMTEYQPYGVRHFLRDADPEAASELRRRQVPLRDGRTLRKGKSADTDRFRLGGLLVYRTLVLRRSPVQSRPPSPYRLTWRGDYYEVWQRPGGLESSVIGHLGLGTDRDPSAVPACSAVQELARKAGPGGTLAAAKRPPVETIPLQKTSHPTAWQWAAYPRSLLPVTPGTIGVQVRVPRSGRYEIWLGGSVRPDVDLTVDGRPVGQVRHQLNNEGEYVLLGRARLGKGRHALEIRFHGADLHPGSGGAPSPIGPLQLSAGDTADARVSQLPSKRAAELCGKPWDWIEALAPGGTATD